MATTGQKIALSPSRDIPFNKLVLSQSNVRRIKSGVSIEELAEDIARRTLLQSINVRPVRDAEGRETGMYEIPAGGRRYRALELLVKQKRLAKTTLIPCIVRQQGIAEEDSLAENVHRAPLHPLDQFRAFQALRDRGQSEEDIAAAFFVTVNVVKQRLRLASVCPSLLDIYAEDGMSLEHLMAFTVSADHKRQKQVWKAVQNCWNKEPHQIRRMLTEHAVRASDRRARYVGVAIYEAAGGLVLHDLFQGDDGGWLQDAGLLDGLVAEKLKHDAEAIATEGWKWIELAVDFPYGHADHLRQLEGEPAGMSGEEKATFEALKAEYDKLEAQYENAEELPDAVDERLGEIETTLEAFDNRSLIYDPADIARAGVFISLNHEGQLDIERGYVRPDDDAAASKDDEATEDRANPHNVHTPQRAIITIAGDETSKDEGDGVRPLPDRLLGELTAHRTLALRDAIGANPHVALTALLHHLCRALFHHDAQGGCLEASLRPVSFAAQAADLKDSVSAQSVSARHETLKADMPSEDGALWGWLSDLSDQRRGDLLAHCVSLGVNALHERANPYGGGVSVQGVRRRLGQADRLGRAVNLDMAAAGWAPSVHNYLGRVPKQRILDAVREGKGEHAAELIAHLKKSEMAEEAERLLAGSGWLPEPLRLANPEGAAPALPDFLEADGEDAKPEADDERPARRRAR